MMVLSTPVNVWDTIGIYNKNGFEFLRTLYPCPLIMNVKTQLCWSLSGSKNGWW
jgi:hypothetical protein